MRTRSTLLAAAFGVCALTAAADDWPQWRGPNRDNHVTGFRAPATWPKELTRKWKVPIGEGFASPVLVGDKLYVFGRKGGDETTACLDAATGKEVWADKYAAVAVTGIAAGGKGGGERFTGPRSSPAAAAGKVCTFGVGGVVSCLDAATGKVAWRKDTKAQPKFYTASSPVVADGVCVVYIGADRRGQLTGFDLATGDEKWKWAGDGPSYGSPVVADIGGTKQVVALTDKNLVGVGLADGKLLWQTPLSTGRYQTGTPVVDGATVICAGTAVTVEKTGDGFAAKSFWKGQAPHQYCTPVLTGGRLYGLTGTGRAGKLYCQDAKTGKLVWEDGTSRGECGTVLDAGPVLLALTSDSTLVAFKPGEKDYEEVAKYKVADTPTWSSPVVVGNRVFVKDRESLALWVIE